MSCNGQPIEISVKKRAGSNHGDDKIRKCGSTVINRDAGDNAASLLVCINLNYSTNMLFTTNVGETSTLSQGRHTGQPYSNYTCIWTIKRGT
jgi:hypothetical protein